MNIKQSNSGSSVSSLKRAFKFFRKLKLKWIVVILVFLVSITATALYSVYYGMYLFKVKKAETYDMFLENAVEAKLNIIPNYLKGMFGADPERLVIDIKHEHFQKLAYKREIALTRGILLTEADDMVPAEIRFREETIPVKIRLKGDWLDHLIDEKWSFRIKTRKDHTLMGMKQFSIHRPEARNFVYEWIIHQALRRENILALRYEFVEVVVNGKNLGIYALEEHFEKRVIEHNQFREGPILKFNEDYMWIDRAAHNLKGEFSPTGLQEETAGNIDAFKLNSVIDNPGMFNQFMIAHNLLEGFRNGQLPTHKVFDIGKLAKFYALSDLLGASHSMIWHNLRFYYNPVTSLLEPIGFDANGGKETIHVLGSNRAFDNPATNFKDLVFSDVEFYRQYVFELQRIADETYLESLLKEIDTDLQRNLKIIYKEYPFFHYSKSVFYQNIKRIQSVLNPVKGLHAYFYEPSASHIMLQLGNIQALPLEVLNVSFRDSIFFKPEQEVILQPKISEHPVQYHKIPFIIPNEVAWVDSMARELTVQYRILGTNRVRQESAYPWPNHTEEFAEKNFIRRNPNAKDFKFISIDESAKKIYIAPGKWTIDRSLIIPRGYMVICREGTILDLKNSATILCYSPWDFRGTEEAPIVIQSSDSTGQGVAVLDAQQESILEYVTFHNLSNPSQEGWALTGAVTFYESPLQVSHCQFAYNRCEDALNIFRAEFLIDRSLFTNTQADAFDGDFVKGKVTNTFYVACGNDGIDVSGSYIEVSHVTIDGSGDKGLSAGENSQIIADNITILNTELAVASKDLSEVQINKIKITDCQVGFTAYQKKAEFGSGVIKVREMEMSNVKVPYLIEENSRMVLDGKPIAPSRQNVKEILYGVEFGKSSR